MSRKRATDWSQAFAWYALQPNATARDVAQHFGVSESSAARHMAQERWVERRDEAQRARAAQAIAQRASSTADELAAFNADDVRLARGLRAMVARRMAAVPASKDGTAELASLASTLERAQRIGRLALGAPTEQQALTGADGGPVATVQASASLEDIRALLEAERQGHRLA